MAKRLFVPVYQKDGNEIILIHSAFVGSSEQEAHDIALGSMLVECILLGMTFLRVQEIDTERMPHTKAMMAGMHVAIIAGPDGPDPAAAEAALKEKDMREAVAGG